ncbi:MAG: ThuA domain-containing protein [Bacteroidota bacterium]
MKFGKLLSVGLIYFILLNCSEGQIEQKRVLIFSKTAGYHHTCIESGYLALEKLCTTNAIEVDSTTNSSDFNTENLSKYAAVIFFNTTGNVLNVQEEIAFQNYIQEGGGYVGIHAASDTEHDWAWYGRLVGAYFISHPKIQEAKFIVEDASFAATNFLPKEWIRTDELYNLGIVNKEVNVVLSVDEESYEGGTNGKEHPMAWYHEYDGGRAFYTALGHTHSSYEEAYFLKHLLGGIRYAMGVEDN